jgi:hypothetical protein
MHRTTAAATAKIASPDTPRQWQLARPGAYAAPRAIAACVRRPLCIHRLRKDIAGAGDPSGGIDPIREDDARVARPPMRAALSSLWS